MPRATIDIGTNSVLLLIAEMQAQQLSPPLVGGDKGEGEPLQVIKDCARVSRLGEKLHQTSRFSEKAMDRTFQVLKDYKALCDKQGVSHIEAVGTAAFRKSSNASEFIERVYNELKIKIRIISGQEEAELSYHSITHDFGHLGPSVMALDIGGGSTELITQVEEKTKSVSLNIGVVTLLEKFLKNDPPKFSEIKALQETLQEQLKKDLTSFLKDRTSPARGRGPLLYKYNNI